MKIIKISALWCSGCLITNKNIKKLKEEYKDIEIVEYDYDFDEEEVEKYNVGNILPVLIIYKNDLEIDRIIGEKSYDYIKNTIERIEDE